MLVKGGPGRNIFHCKTKKATIYFIVSYEHVPQASSYGVQNLSQ